MTYFRKIFARTAISYIHFIEIGELTLNCASIWERSHMTSARFLSPPVSIKRPPLMTSAFARPPFQRTPYTIHYSQIQTLNVYLIQLKTERCQVNVMCNHII